MSARTVFPELFVGACAEIEVDGKPKLALRWALSPQIGLPRALFHVWAWDGSALPVQAVTTSQRTAPEGRRRIDWSGPVGAAVSLAVTVPAGSTVTFRGHTGRGGEGRPVDEATVVGTGAAATVTLWGSPIGSVVATASVTVSSAVIVPMNALLEAKSWVLVERIGLPVDEGWASTGYPTDKHGVVGSELPPTEDAMRRLSEGASMGWPADTDRGLPAPKFVRPDPKTFVFDDLATLRDALRQMLEREPDPALHAAWFTDVKTRPPRSLRDVEAGEGWQDTAAAEIAPLGVSLAMAATDTDAALALGFGTTREGVKASLGGAGGRDLGAVVGTLGGRTLSTGTPTAPTRATLAAGAPTATLSTSARAANPPRTVEPLATLHLVTVEHKVELEVAVPGFPGITVNVPYEGELATVIARPVVADASPVAAFSAARGALDRPMDVDRPWLGVTQLGWALPVHSAPVRATASAYALAHAIGGDAPAMLLPERLAGGHVPFVPAVASSDAPSPRAAFTVSALPELFPGEPGTDAFSAVPADVFGRWGAWMTIDDARFVVAPQIPAIRRAELVLRPGDPTVPLRKGDVNVEFVWDWADRRPEQVTVRVLVHPEDADPPAVDGTVLGIGAPASADLVLSFAAATEDTPPAGATLVADDTAEHLRTYRVAVPVDVDFGAAPRVRATVRARAAERVRPSVLSGWSPDGRASIASPVPPPPPFVPAAMTWASVPDPAGVARMTLSWGAAGGNTAAYAVLAADEAAIRREAGLPAADLETPPEQRLPALRALDFGVCRAAFRRVADRVVGTTLPVVLPRGSQLVQFYAVVPISSTGVAGALPTSGNAYVAVAVPRVLVPQTPRLTVRDAAGAGAITVEVAEGRVPVDRIELYRTRNPLAFYLPEEMGPPWRVLDAATDGVLGADGVLRFTVEDPAPGPAWAAVGYRCIARAATDLATGRIGGRSAVTGLAVLVPTTTAPPPLADLVVEPPGADPAFRLVRFASEVPRRRSPAGVHGLVVRALGPDADLTVARAEADGLPTFDAATPPTPSDAGSLFVWRPPAPAAPSTCAWVPADSVAVTVEVRDPAGQRSQLAWSAP